MIGIDALQSVQYVSVNEKRFAVLEANAWEALIEWLETVEDLQSVKSAFKQLGAADGNREKAGWLKWDEVKEELV